MLFSWNHKEPPHTVQLTQHCPIQHAKISKLECPLRCTIRTNFQPKKGSCFKLMPKCFTTIMSFAFGFVVFLEKLLQKKRHLNVNRYPVTKSMLIYTFPLFFNHWVFFFFCMLPSNGHSKNCSCLFTFKFHLAANVSDVMHPARLQFSIPPPSYWSVETSIMFLTLMMAAVWPWNRLFSASIIFKQWVNQWVRMVCQSH